MKQYRKNLKSDYKDLFEFCICVRWYMWPLIFVPLLSFAIFQPFLTIEMMRQSKLK